MKNIYSKMLKKTAAFALCLASVLSLNQAFAQNASVSGVVSSAQDNMPIIGATVIVEGQTTGAITDIDGKFTIKNAPKSGKLVFSYFGYTTQIIDIIDGKNYTVNLESESQAIDEVIVVGYGTQRKVEVTGSVSRVAGEAVSKMSTADVGSALQGQVAGVNVQMSTGQPGDVANIQIRGISSIDGKNQPLYVVDGIPYDGDPGLSPNEIASIDILKDAASAAIYGTRGSGGVILITTKRGSEGKMQVSVDANYGTQIITSRLYMTNAAQATAVKALETMLSSGGIPSNEAWQKIKTNQTGFADESSMVDILEQNLQPVSNVMVNLSGGANGATYSVIGNYFSQDGVVVNSGYERFNIRANTEFVRKKWKFSANMSTKIDEKNTPAANIYREVYKYGPTSPVFDPDLEIGTTPGTDEGEKKQMGSILAKFKEDNTIQNRSFNGNFSVGYDILDCLNFTTRLGAGYNIQMRETINPLFEIYDEDGEIVPNSETRSGVKRGTVAGTSLVWENMLNFQKSFGKHNLKATAVISTEKYNTDAFEVQRYNLISNDLPHIGATTGEITTGIPNYSTLRTTTLIGMLARAQYNYDSRYMLSMSIRRDASSRFAKENRWGSFPSISAGWNISEEEFFEPFKDKIEMLKLRASYGTTGNQNFSDYQYLVSMTNLLDYAFGGVDGTSVDYGTIQTAYANAEVKWETTQQVNLGVDMTLLRSRLSITADVYQTTKRDMLLPLKVPPSAGTGLDGDLILNVGDMENKGVEFAVNWRDEWKDLEYNVGLTASRNINTVTKMSGSNKRFALGELNPGNNADYVTFVQEGMEAGAFLLYQTAGVINTEEKLIEYSKLNPSATMGDLIYVDKNEDGVITDDDRVYSGSGAPELELGLNLGLNWKNFDFSMIWYASLGNEVIDGSKCAAYQNRRHLDMLSSWTQFNPYSPIPVLHGDPNHDNYSPASDYWVEDGSYLRLNNVVLGYSFPQAKLAKVGISKLRVYVAADNIWTITGYKGYNPGVGNDGLKLRGVDMGVYPIAAQVRGGVQLNF